MLPTTYYRKKNKNTVLQDVKDHPKQVSFPSSGYLNTFPQMLLQAPGLEVPAAL